MHDEIRYLYITNKLDPQNAFKIYTLEDTVQHGKKIKKVYSYYTVCDLGEEDLILNSRAYHHHFATFRIMNYLVKK